MSRTGLFSAAALVVSVFAAPALCLAADLPPVSSAPAAGDSAPNPFADATPMDAGSLAKTQGGSNTSVSAVGALSEQDLTASNTGNAITGSFTNGTINIGSNAFSGFNGVGNFVMNTGNQDNIQGTLSINVVIANIPAIAAAAP
jgi:hypothetical protein